jgi:hypothetical protein
MTVVIDRKLEPQIKMEFVRRLSSVRPAK